MPPSIIKIKINLSQLLFKKKVIKADSNKVEVIKIMINAIGWVLAQNRMLVRIRNFISENSI